MGPFIEKIKGMDRDKLPRSGEWAFLRDWESPIVEERLEELSERGRRDSKVGSKLPRNWAPRIDDRQALGRYIRNQYNELFPSRDRKSLKGHKKDKGKPSYKVCQIVSIV